MRIKTRQAKTTLTNKRQARFGLSNAQPTRRKLASDVKPQEAAKKTVINKAPTMRSPLNKVKGVPVKPVVVRKARPKKTAPKKTALKKVVSKKQVVVKATPVKKAKGLPAKKFKLPSMKKGKYRFLGTEKIVEVKDLVVSFPIGHGAYFDAVKNVDFDIYRGEILGLVGESGSGKSTIGKTLLGLNSYQQGNIAVNGKDVPGNKYNISRKIRKDMSRDIQYIFQDPAGALNPTRTVRGAIRRVIMDNQPHKKYFSEAISKIVEQVYNDATIEKIFPEVKSEEVEQYYKWVKADDAIVRANDGFYKRLNRTDTLKNTKLRANIEMQKRKQITDREYLDNAKQIKTEYKEMVAKLNNKYSARIAEANASAIKTSEPQILKTIKLFKSDLIEYGFSSLNAGHQAEEAGVSRIVGKHNGNDIASCNKEFVTRVNQIAFIEKNGFIEARVKKVLELVSFPKELLDRKPHTLSGGQQQRVVIGRALAASPKVLVADEPIAALDVSIQAQVINMLKDLRDMRGISILFIAHDLTVVRGLSDRIMVMYRGDIVEEGTPDELFTKARHPYTKALLVAIPELQDSSIDGELRPDFDKTPSRKWFKISDTHRVYCLDKEFKKWKAGK